MNLNLLRAFFKSALHFITGSQLRIKEHTDFQNRSWINQNLLVMEWRAERKPNN